MKKIQELKTQLISAAQTQTPISYKDCADILGLTTHRNWGQDLMPDITEALSIIDYTNNVYLACWVQYADGTLPSKWNDTPNLTVQEFHEYYQAWRSVSHLYYKNRHINAVEYSIGNRGHIFG